MTRDFHAPGRSAVYAANGMVATQVDTRRGACGADSVIATPAVQLFRFSNAAFQDSMKNAGRPNVDLVIVSTHTGCGDTTHNRIIGYYSDNLEVKWTFNGAGTRWPAELTKPSHPANGLYNAVRPVITGASCGCAAVFGATKEVAACGLPEIKDHALPGTPGLASIRRYLAEGWQTLVF